MGARIAYLKKKRIKKIGVPEKGLKGIAFGVHENNQGKKDGILERRNLSSFAKIDRCL